MSLSRLNNLTDNNIINPKDIQLDVVRNNKSSDSPTINSEEEEEVSLKKGQPNSKRYKEAKVAPIDKYASDNMNMFSSDS